MSNLSFANIKAYFQKNPLMGFVAVIIVVTILLGIGAFIGTRPKDTADKSDLGPTPTEEVSDSGSDSGTDSDTGSSASDTTASEHKAAPTVANNEGGTDVTVESVKLNPSGPTIPQTTATTTPAASKTNINLLGDIYEDNNCNGTRDSGENAVTKTVTINIYKMPEFSAYTSVTTDGSGHYSYNGSIDKGSSIQLQAGAVSPDGYKSNPKFSYPTSTFSSDSPSARVDIPQVPNDKVSACQ